MLALPIFCYKIGKMFALTDLLCAWYNYLG